MKNLQKSFLNILIGSSLAVASMSHALMLTFDDEDIRHGTVIADQYSDLGVAIRADNIAREHVVDRAVAFNTNHKFWTADEDLRLDPKKYPGVGNVLIIQENNWCRWGHCFWPDDEGKRRAGSLFFEFDKAINSLSFDILDIESQETSYIKLYDGSNTEVKSIKFADLDGAAFGNNVFSKIGAISLAGLGISTVEFSLGGSGALDNISVSPVPIPASLSIMLLGLAGLYMSRRKLLKNA